MYLFGYILIGQVALCGPEAFALDSGTADL